MRRALVWVLAAGLAVIAWTMPSPPAPLPVAAPIVDEPAEVPAFGHCPWVSVTDRYASTLGIGAVEPTEARVVFPLSGEIADERFISVPARSAALVDVAGILPVAELGAELEFDGSAGASVLTEGEGVLAAASCTAVLAKEWVLAGGTTANETEMEVHLFNPFPEDASVTLIAASELGVEQALELENVPVPARTVRVVDLRAVFPQRESLAVSIVATTGNVFPEGVMRRGGEVALWPATAQSPVWTFPAVGVTSGANARVSVFNAGIAPVAVEVEVIDPAGSVTVIAELTVEPLAEASVDPGVDAGAAAVRVRADGPVGAALRTSTPGGLAAVSGLDSPAATWVFPVAPTAASPSLWLTNPAGASITVTVSRLGPGLVGSPDKVVVPAGSVRRVVLDPPTLVDGPDGPAPSFRGWLVESTGPFYASMSLVGADGAGLALLDGVGLDGLVELGG